MWLLGPTLRRSAYSIGRTRVTRPPCGRARQEKTISILGHYLGRDDISHVARASGAALMCAGDLELAGGHAYIALLAALIPYRNRRRGGLQAARRFRRRSGRAPLATPRQSPAPGPTNRKGPRSQRSGSPVPAWGRGPPLTPLLATAQSKLNPSHSSFH